jgi:hypothetical protein
MGVASAKPETETLTIEPKRTTAFFRIDPEVLELIVDQAVLAADERSRPLRFPGTLSACLCASVSSR